jgi:hypothetical protein
MRFNDFFDVSNVDHLKAYQEMRRTGTWPQSFQEELTQRGITAIDVLDDFSSVVSRIADQHLSVRLDGESVDEPNWIVNDAGELGVEIRGRCFFLYKGHSIEYSGLAEDGDESILRYRSVEKREFGECCHPADWTLKNRTCAPDMTMREWADRYDWRPLPLKKGA